MKADFSKIINDSIQITKSNKKLWVLGVVVATLGAGANFSSLGSFNNLSKEINKQKQENSIDYNMPQALGSATNTLTDVVKTIPVSFYGAFGLLLAASILLGTAVSFYGQSWAQSGLIHGINKQTSGEILSLYQMSDYGKLSAVEVIKIKIFPGLLFALAVAASAIVLIIPDLLLGETEKPLLIFLAILWAVVVVIAGIVLAASVNLGILTINLESLKWKEGFKRGFGLFKKYFLDVVVMSVINCFAGCVFGLVSMVGLLVLGGIGVAAVVGVVAFPPSVVAAAPILFLALLALIMLMGIVGTISAVFKQSTWVLLYKQLTEVTDGQQ